MEFFGKGIVVLKNKQVSTEMQLIGLRALFEQFGVLHELQILQLKYWPYSIDPNLTSSEAEVNMEDKVVSFTWVAEKPSKINPKYISRVKELLKMVRFLLGDDWAIQILLNNESIFSRNDCFPAPKPTPSRA